MPPTRFVLFLLLAVAATLAHGTPAKTPQRVNYALDAQARGVSETINNIST